MNRAKSRRKGTSAFTRVAACSLNISCKRWFLPLAYCLEDETALHDLPLQLAGPLARYDAFCTAPHPRGRDGEAACLSPLHAAFVVQVQCCPADAIYESDAQVRLLRELRLAKCGLDEGFVPILDVRGSGLVSEAVSRLQHGLVQRATDSERDLIRRCAYNLCRALQCAEVQ